MEEVIKHVIETGGPYGIALLIVAWVINRVCDSRVQDEKARSQELRDDKKQLVDVLENNSRAMASVSVAVDNCTRAVDHCTDMVQRLFNKEH